jgi:hypothetical protein
MDKLTPVQIRLINNYATIVLADASKISTVPDNLKPYVLAEVDRRKETSN